MLTSTPHPMTKMKSDNILRKYGREVVERLRSCGDESQMKALLQGEGFTVSDTDLSAIAEVMKTMGGGLRELTLDELDQITGGTII